MVIDNYNEGDTDESNLNESKYKSVVSRNG